MKYSVIIIGAGMAGLSCCHKLIEYGIKDILLIEANNRIGGRINTINFGSLIDYFI
jgi:spermine oxidase